jgi:flagellar M-ring protein FliF
MDLRTLAAKLSPRGWAIAGGSAGLLILFIVVVMNMASQPSYSTLMTGLDPAQTGKMTAALDTRGIAYQLQNNGTALAVQSAQTAQARIALATAGLLTSQQPGMSLLDNQQLGASNFQQQITYQRALEGQLAQTIQSIQGVSSAQVQIVLPNSQDQLFADNSSAGSASAAVLLSDSGTLDPSSVRGIAEMVSSSVPELSLNKVTITDGTGQLLWPTSDTSGTGGSLLAKQTAESRYDAMMAGQAEALLAQTLGPGKAEVAVNADLDANQATSDILSYGRKGIALQSHKETETLVGNGPGATGGTTGTIPGYAQTSGSGKSNYRHVIADTTYGVNKTVTHDVIAPGKINYQKVSLVLDSSVPASAVPALKAAVANAVGLQPGRGDAITVARLPFAKAPVPAAAPVTTKLFGYVKYLVVGLGTLIFLMLIARMLRRREREPFAGTPTWLRELEAPRPLAVLEQEHQDAQPHVMQLRTPVNPARLQIEDLVEREPDRVAAQVRAWMAED